jgi:metalloendopeptidase OMA1, mitochondrial
MREWLEEVGFVDVHEVRFKVPIGTWGKASRLKDLGKLWELVMDPGLEALSTRLFSEVLKWDEAETQVRNPTL